MFSLTYTLVPLDVHLSPLTYTITVMSIYKRLRDAKAVNQNAPSKKRIRVDDGEIYEPVTVTEAAKTVKTTVSVSDEWLMFLNPNARTYPDDSPLCTGDGCSNECSLSRGIKYLTDEEWKSGDNFRAVKNSSHWDSLAVFRLDPSKGVTKKPYCNDCVVKRREFKDWFNDPVRMVCGNTRTKFPQTCCVCHTGTTTQFKWDCNVMRFECGCY